MRPVQQSLVEGMARPVGPSMRPDPRPCHLVDKPGDRRSRCGLRDPLPVCWAKYAQRHIDGRSSMPVCPDCLEGLEL